MPLFLSLKVAAIATLITVALSIPLAYKTANYRGRSKLFIDAVVLLPLVLPPTVLGFVLLWLFGSRGPLNWLSSTGFNIVFTWWAAVITATVVALPLMYRSAQAAFEQVDPQLLSIAKTLGASEQRVFFQVALPLAKPGIFSGVLLSFARALGEFGATLMLAGNIPGKTQTLPMAVYFAVEGGDFATATVWSVVMGAIALFTVVLSDIVKQLPSTRKNKLIATTQNSSAVLSSFNSAQFSPPEQLSNRRSSPSLSKSLSVNITKQLSGFTLRVQFSTQSKLIGILGSSGAGKSMLLRCLAGIESPDEGTILLSDRILYDSKKKTNISSTNRAVSLLVQNYALFPHLTVAENIAFGIQDNPQCHQIVLQELAAMQLSEYANVYPSQLSGGQQQRVALARALVCQPQLLLLDEPFSALDTHLRSQLSQQLFNRLKTFNGIALIVSHNLDEIYQSDLLLVLQAGKSVRCAAPQGIFEQPRLSAIAQLTGPVNQSAIQLDGDHFWASNWQIQLKIRKSDHARINRDIRRIDDYRIAIRPRDVFFITKNRYHSSQFISQTTVNIAASERTSPHPDSQPFPESTYASVTSSNQSQCWLSTHRLSPESVTLWLKLHQPPAHANDYHLQAIVDKPTWEILQQQPSPWTVYLPPQNVIVLGP